MVNRRQNTFLWVKEDLTKQCHDKGVDIYLKEKHNLLNITWQVSYNYKQLVLIEKKTWIICKFIF